LARLVPFRVEAAFGNEVIGRWRSVAGSPSSLLPSLELVVYISTEFKELYASQALKLVASLVWWRLGVAVP